MPPAKPICVRNNHIIFDDGFQCPIPQESVGELRVFLREQMNPATLKWINARRREREDAVGIQKYGKWFLDYRDALAEREG